MGRVKTVVIIGAGLAGLKAADVLLATKLVNVIILEGRDRIGGRAYTSTHPSFKTPLDLGCAWIHGTEGNPLWPIAQSHSAKTHEIASSAIEESGQWLSEKVTEEVMTYIFNLADEAIKYSKDNHADIDPDTSFATFCRKRIESDRSLSEDQKRRISGMIHFYTNISAAEIEDQSLRNYSLEEQLPGDTPLLLSTYAPLVKHTASPAMKAGIIKLNQKVTRVDTTSTPVLEIEDMITHRTSTIDADIVICTLPLGVLQTSDLFHPALPKELTFAISELAMGTAEKLYIRLSSAFWTNSYPGNSDIFAFLPDEGGELVEFISLATLGPFLLFYSAGHVASHIADLWKLGKEVVIEWVMQFIRRMPGYNDEYIVDLFSTDWSHDPFSRGSYSYSPTGSMDTKASCHRISQGYPQRGLFFAGEHAQSLEAGYEIGTAHGAYASGEYCAHKVLRHLGVISH